MICKNCGNDLHNEATICTCCGWKTNKWKKQIKRGKAVHSANILVVILLSLVAVFFVFMIISVL